MWALKWEQYHWDNFDNFNSGASSWVKQSIVPNIKTNTLFIFLENASPAVWRMLRAGQIGQDTFQVLQRWSLWWCVCTCSTYVTFVIYVWLKSMLEVHVAFRLEIHCRLSPLCFTTVWHMFFVIVFCWNFRFSKAAVLEVLYLVVFVVQCSFCGCILVCCTYKTISKYDVCCQFC